MRHGHGRRCIDCRVVTTLLAASSAPRTCQAAKLESSRACSVAHRLLKHWVMSRARQVLAGQFYLLTRRCTQRQFLLRPDEETNNAFIYCLGEAAKRFDIAVVLPTAESNHHHTVIYDVHGNLPAFMEHF